MGTVRLALFTSLLAIVMSQIGVAAYSKQITGIDLAQFEGRDVLVLRTTGDVAPPSAFRSDKTAAALLFSFPKTGADDVKTMPKVMGSLIQSVDIVAEQAQDLKLVIGLEEASLATQRCFRFTQPSSHVLLLEIFREPGLKEATKLITDPDSLIGMEQDSTIHSTETKLKKVHEPINDPLAAIPVVNLSRADPQRVMGLAASLGLLDLKGTIKVSTERWGEVTVSPSGQSLVSWTGNNPPGEILLCGDTKQIAEFLAQADPQQLINQQELVTIWTKQQPRSRSRTLLGGTNPDTRSRVKDDPYNGLYYAETLPGGGRLSDIRVTMNATGGLNLYDVLDYLSQISGISIILDPYMFDEPTGSTRTPLQPEQNTQQYSGPGFRSASEFNPSLQRTGSVRGNFISVPFDEVLRTILEMHELEFVVMNEGQPGGKRYGSNSTLTKYEKPVILVTSKERLQQELPGTNETDLHQLHYADPEQITHILQEFDMISSTGSGWYIYGGNGTGGGNYGTNGGRPGGGGNNIATAPASIVVYQGYSREPVYEIARRELSNDRAVIRVILNKENSEYLTTVLTMP